MTSQSLNLKFEIMEKDAIKRNKYDYDRIMREYDIAMRLNRMKGLTEKSLEKKQKLEQEKLKQMEEKREQLLSRRIYKINEKLKEREKILSRKNNLIKSSNLPHIDIQSNIERMKEEEENYIAKIEDQILDKYEMHDNNYKNYKKSIQDKYLNNEKEYENRVKKYKKKVEMRDLEKLKEFNKQQKENSLLIKERFNLQNPKIKIIKERNKKQLEEIKERQFEIYQNDEKRRKEILRKLNYVPRLNKFDYNKKDFIQRENLSNIQKENLERVNIEKIETNNLYTNQNNNLKYITEELKEEDNNKMISQPRSNISKEELDKKFEEVNKMIQDLENKNYINRK